MFDWVNSFLAGLDKEGAAVLGTGIGAIGIAIAAGVRGMRNGLPTKAATRDAAEMITQMSCGAPEVTAILRVVADENRLALKRQEDLMHDIQKIRDTVTVIEDRTRRG